MIRLLKKIEEVVVLDLGKGDQVCRVIGKGYTEKLGFGII